MGRERGPRPEVRVWALRTRVSKAPCWTGGGAARAGKRSTTRMARAARQREVTSGLCQLLRWAEGQRCPRGASEERHAGRAERDTSATQIPGRSSSGWRVR